MGWFSRTDKGAGDAGGSGDEGGRRADGAGVAEGDDGPEYDPSVPMRPRVRPVGDAEVARVTAGLAELDALGVDVDDLASLGAGFDAAMGEWTATPERRRADEDARREPWVIGLGEHLVRHTDLEWSLVHDAFGTDLAVAGGEDDFVVVPANLVGARWMGGQQGWVPGVLAHLVRVREGRWER
ncbi:DUF3806 domain-containing protein [Dermatophilaceae bacterium Soc4.6]